MSILGKTGRQYWQDELSNMMGVKSGQMLPQELSEFKGMANMFNAQTNDQMSNIVRMLSQKGITGGAASGAITGADENAKSGLLKMIQNIYGQVNARGGQAANVGMDWDKFMLGLYNNMHQARQQNDLAKKSMWLNFGKALAAAGAGGLAGIGGATAMAAPTAGTGVGGVSDLSSMFGNKFSYLG